MSAEVVPIPERSAPEDQARRWILRIDAGPLSASERVQLRSWLDEDPHHAQLLDVHAMLWSAAAQAVSAPATSTAAFDAGRQAGPFQWLAPAFAACACLLVAGGLWFAQPSTPPQVAVQAQAQAQAHSTGVGEHRPVPLADGSRMHLNTGSKALVVFTKERRRIQLEAGEGLFDVAKDASRPFEVVVGSTIVRAVGTRFLVRRQANGQAEVTVFEGVVELLKAQPAVHAPGVSRALPAQPPVRLVVGQSASEQAQVIVLRSLPALALEHKLAWQQDRIVFDNTPLAMAIEQVNRYGATPLTLDDPSLRDVSVSGAFSTREIPVFLRSLQQGFGLQVEQRPEGYVISRHRAR